ncbi:MAG: fumarylacetoacetate hydrolase family protein [Beijerinckiaceae bacterium]
MRFVTFNHDGFERAGILQGDAASPDDRIVDLAHASMRASLDGCEPQLSALITRGLSKIAQRLGGDAHQSAPLRLGNVTLLAPLPRPRRIFGIAHNYRDALAERGMPLPTAPMLFMKDGASVIGPNQAIVLPADIGGVTYEAEIAAVIGRRAGGVTIEEALDHVAAYGIFNDISASELIRRDGHFDRGKNLPTFGPFGPYLATADEIPNPQKLRIGLRMDGRSVQDSSTAEMLFGVAELISTLSRQTPLEPGDVIATGTPAGVAPVQKPPTWIRPGMKLEAWVEGLGMLANPVTEGPPCGF